ncbi:ornithine cyclodeaminase [Roseibium hamelinense]|uniref:ornithine cyclodeaminase n=1 Tax=Roseibium hamelinense TaxID=150831 RepID=UPI001478A932|nr:ornithine cyclodeaminase [Roseibium hamelinense]
MDLLQQDAASVASGVYMLFSGRTGAPIALLDGSYMNLWRQAGIHALAASYLAREDISRLLIIGTHPLLAYLLSAYAEIRDIRSVLIYGADDALCRRLASQPALSRMTIGTANDLSETVSGADMITVLQGPVPDISLESVGPGLHIDVIVPELAIPQALKEDARIFISDNVSSDDTGTLEIAATLHELAQGDKAGRRFYSQLTLFQSSKASGLADLATGGHIFLRT